MAHLHRCGWIVVKLFGAAAQLHYAQVLLWQIAAQHGSLEPCDLPATGKARHNIEQERRRDRSCMAASIEGYDESRPGA